MSSGTTSKIAVWYHCKLSGAGIPDEDFAISVMAEQMAALKSSGLADAADEIHIGSNGGDANGMTAALVAPEKATLHIHGPGSRSELPTLAALIQWLPDHRDWLVFYHHSKGVTKPNDKFHHHHRRTMEKSCVLNWKQCVKDLERGYDAVGINLVDPVKRPIFAGRFFAGNYWWATAKYLITLPAIPDNDPAYTLNGRLMAEHWIGTAPRRGRFMDYERQHLYG